MCLPGAHESRGGVNSANRAATNKRAVDSITPPPAIPEHFMTHINFREHL